MSDAPPPPPALTPQEEAKEEAMKIRMKRLERLGGGGSASPSPSGSSTPAAASTATGPSASTSHLPSPRPAVPSPSPTTPISRPTPPSASAARAPVASSSSSSTAPVPFKKPSSSTPTPQRVEVKPKVVVKPVPSKSFEDWESDSVAWVFGVTLQKDRAEAVDWTITWLKELSEEVESEGAAKPLRTPPSLADRILIARLSLDPNTMSDNVDELQVIASLPERETVLEYLVGCWKRLYAIKLGADREGYPAEQRASWTTSFEEVKEAIVGYIGESLKDPGMFPQPQDKPLGIVELLPPILSIVSPSPSHPIPSQHLQNLSLPQLFSDLSAKFAEGDEFAQQMLSPILSLMLQEYWKGSAEANAIITGDGWIAYMAALGKVSEAKEVASLLPTLPIWLLPSATAPQLEYMSLLGPLTRLSVFPREFPGIPKEYFSKPTERKRADIDSAQATLQGTLFSLQESLFAIYGNIVRSKPEAREAVLELFATVAKKNEKRSGMRVDRATVSSDSFMTNLQVILLRFFEPVMDFNFSKIDKVDADYFRKSTRLSITEETKIRATKEEAEEYFAAPPTNSTPVNFISEIFFLACAFQHVGLGKTVSNRGELEKRLGELEKELKQVEADDSWRGTPAQPQGEAMIKKFKDDMSRVHSYIHAYDTQLLDPDLVSRTMTFQSFVMTWFVRMVDPTHSYPSKMIKLPLPAEAPMAFRMLPEYILEDIAEYQLFLMAHRPQTFDTSDQTKLITFVITFLSGEYVKNPFVKSKLVEFLSMGCHPWGYYKEGVLGPALSFHPLAVEQLVPSLIGYYIDMEATGGHQQFYDKFSMRRHAITVLRYLWKNAIHRETFQKDAIENLDRFVVFANMHMNDCTFLLEESLTNLAAIYALETEMSDKPTWDALPEAERKDKESKLKSAENQAGWSTDGGRRNISVLKEWTSSVREPFLKPEIIDRLAAMLCFNLATLVGPKMQELKVRDPKKYRFDAKSLLGELSDIFRNLGVEQRFVEAVAKEGRSYRKEIFVRLAGILQNRAVRTPGEIQQIVLFCDKVEETKAKIEAEEEGEDIPDDYLDPLMYTLMRDPVILPSSKTTIDLSTIKAHLLSDPTDPFNRMPLKIEDCLPDVELKAKIEAYLSERRRIRTVEPMEVDGLPSA